MRIAGFVVTGLVVLGLSGLALACAGCSTVAEQPATQTTVAKPVNTVCPIMGGKVDANKIAPELTRQFAGKTVGFCCAMCPAEWDKLNDTQKQTKLDASIQTQPQATPAPAHKH